MEPEGSSPHSQQPATCFYAKPDYEPSWMRRNMINFYGEELLASRPTS